ncbi:T9SS C-terminal target domain-containing protein [Parabacteroides segnis]|uniref:T9SS C-terminal target domain-containing protein n=1 Tax=Parabacteroides segnis TaxID=2763058 RepID=UPI003516509E
MKTIRQQLRAVPRILAGLLFAFMAAMASVVHASPSPPLWDGLPAGVIVNDGGNDGSAADQAILIKDAAELAYFAQQVNAGEDLALSTGSIQNNGGFPDIYFALSTDIDLNGEEWTPIGNYNNYFQGHFNGDGHTVKGLKVNIQASNRVNAGLFGRVVDGTLRNLGVWLAPDGIVVSSSNGDVSAGGLVGRIDSNDYTTVVIRNCYVEAEGNGAIRITGNNDLRAGGIAGMNSVGLITHCYATVDVEAKSNGGGVQVGGVAGYAQDISYAYATGKVEGRAHSYLYIGGICGAVFASIKNCLALNKEISCITTGGRDEYKNRIAGYVSSGVCFDNYATPGMKLNGQPATGGTTGDYNGADTWSDTFETALKSNPSPDNGWETAWIWTPGQLPLLRKENADGNGYSQDPVRGQTPRKATDYLVSLPWNGSAATQIESTGDGTFGNPILIETAAELAYLAQQVNAGENLTLSDGTSPIQNNDGFPNIYFALSTDIDLNGEEWTPIGRDGYPFSGHFDGRGHTVKGLTVIGDMSYAGLFGRIVNGTLCNLGVSLHEDGIKVSSVAGVNAGGIVGLLFGFSGDVSLRNCYVVGNGKVTSTGNVSYVGGIAGAVVVEGEDNTASLTHCYATVAVEAEATYTCGVGGIVGVSNGTLSHTYATGSVKANRGENQYAGGICGFKGDGDLTLTHNLALNSKVAVESGSDCHRIVGYDGFPDLGSISSNYARPAMLLNGQPVTSTNADDQNGAPTWSNKLKEDLDLSSNEWNNAWIWEDGKLPQLKKLVDAGNNTYDGELSGQTPYSVEDYLSLSWKDAAAKEIENTGNGDGSSPGNPILIKDAAELAYLAQQVNAGGDLTLTNGGTIPNNNGFSGKYFALSADIDLEGGNWTPIGNGEGYGYNPFGGHFDGRGYTVKELTVNGEMSYAGLFGYVVNGTLCNLGVSLHEDGIKVSSIVGVRAGGIVGMLYGYTGDVSLRNCYVVGNGKVEGTSTGYTSYVGGIAGEVASLTDNTASFTHCYATVAVEAGAEATYGCGVGGIVGVFIGVFSGTLSHTYATGSVKANGREDQYAGGICGFKSIGNLTLTHNLALNSKVAVESGSDCHRIVGYDGFPDLGSISSNYARPAMLLNGQPVTSTDTDSFDGSDTWLDTYKADLGEDPASDNSWKSGNWTWTDSNLPQLRRVILDAGGDITGYDEWSSTQTALSASSFLTNKPAPTPPPKPDPEPTPPTVYYTVTLPAVEGAITDPAAGTYEVESWSTFRFYLTLDADYSESQPVITTSRNETLLPRPSDGAYQVKYVRNDVEVYIDGIVKNNPVANETIEAGYPKVWKSGNNLHMQAVTDEPGYIYTADGKLQTVCRLIAGEIRTIQLPAGIYFVRIGNERFKVIL